jgi:hypothetical protein
MMTEQSATAVRVRQRGQLVRYVRGPEGLIVELAERIAS